jgi:CheY-like chemotaxis protein
VVTTSEREQSEIVNAEPRRVLLLESDEALRELFSRILRHLHVEPVAAVDATEAVAALRDHAPELVLLDTRPAEDGVAVLSALRSDPDLAGVPVVTMGTDACAPPAVAAHVTFPFRFIDLTTILLSLLEPGSLGL